MSNTDTLVLDILEHGEKAAKVRTFISTIGPSGFAKITSDQLEQLEGLMLSLPQVEVGITHTFLDGLYIRDGVMPAGSLVLGHHHVHEHFCVILCGRMSWLNADKSVNEIVGPCTFAAKPGRKLLYIHEDVRMQNIHATASWPKECFGSIEKMEDFIYAKTETNKAMKATLKKV
jgi:hypothetical protein